MPSPANAHCTGYEVFEVSSADTGGKLDLEEEEGGGGGRGRGRREGREGWLADTDILHCTGCTEHDVDSKPC